MFYIRHRIRRMPFQVALSFLILLLLSHELAEGFVLCVNPQGDMALELESQDCPEKILQGKRETGGPLGIQCSSAAKKDCCVDISALDEFPPLPSAIEQTHVPSFFLAFFPLPSESLVLSHPLPQRDLSPQGLSPLGPNPVATVRLTI